MTWLQRVTHTLKAAFALRFGRGPWTWGGASLGRTYHNYAGEVADGRGSSIVMACVDWVCRTFPEAPLVVRTRAADGALAVEDEHPLTLLLETPNPYYSGLHLWTATLADWLLTGNAYWVKVRSADTRVTELWWLPARAVEPRWPDHGGPPFISHYDYTVDGQVVAIPRGEIIHFRKGFDPQNLRKGLSPLGSLWREIATDHEAANYTASILRNLGVPGVVISPAKAEAAPSREDLEQVKQDFMQRFGGDHRGEPLILDGPTDVHVLSFSPEQMNVREVARRVPEERVTAIFGTPAVVVGLGAGLDRSTFANFAEAREAAYESMIIPTQSLFAADLQTQLVPEFGDPRRLRLGYDYREVRVLQEDQDHLHTRAREDLKAGLLTLNEARVMIGQDELPGTDGDVYYLPNTVTVKLADDLVPAPVVPLALPPGAARDDDEDTPVLPEAASLDGAEHKQRSLITDDDLVAVRERARALGLADFVEATVNGNGAHG